MKKLLAITALAFGAFTLATTTHAAHFHPQEDASKLTDCDLLKKYRTDLQAIKGSYLEINCEFHYIDNEVTITTDSQKLEHYYTDALIGHYDVTFQNVLIPQGKLQFVYQKVAGGNSPNWYNALCAGYIQALPDLTDHYLHSYNFNNPKQQNLDYEANFGNHNSDPDEKIAIYIRHVD